LLREVRDPSRARVHPKNVEVVHSCSLPHVREEDPFCLPFPCFHAVWNRKLVNASKSVCTAGSFSNACSLNNA
jgi:hypothetical protein